MFTDSSFKLSYSSMQKKSVRKKLAVLRLATECKSTFQQADSKVTGVTSPETRLRHKYHRKNTGTLSRTLGDIARTLGTEEEDDLAQESGRTRWGKSRRAGSGRAGMRRKMGGQSKTGTRGTEGEGQTSTTCRSDGDCHQLLGITHRQEPELLLNVHDLPALMQRSHQKAQIEQQFLRHNPGKHHNSTQFNAM